MHQRSGGCGWFWESRSFNGWSDTFPERISEVQPPIAHLLEMELAIPNGDREVLEDRNGSFLHFPLIPDLRAVCNGPMLHMGDGLVAERSQGLEHSVALKSLEPLLRA